MSASDSPSGPAAWPARRPGRALLVALLLSALALVGILRIRTDPTLESMFPRDDRAAQALSRALNDFAVAEEMLVLASLPEDSAATPEKLTDFSRRLETAVKADPVTSGLAHAVIWKPDESTRRYFEQVVVPNGLYYLEDNAYRNASERLTEEGMRAQLRRNEALLSAPGPAASAAAKTLAKDPLGLRDFLLERFSSLRSTFSTRPGSEALLSRDGRSLLIRVPGTRPVSDLEFTKQFVKEIQRVADAVNTDHLRLDYAGSYPIAAASEKSIRSDAITSSLTSFIYLAGLFFLAYRGAIKLFLLAFGPVLLGNLWGFGAYSLWSVALTPMTAVIGAMLAEMGINYSIHYLSGYDAHRAAGRARLEAAARTTREFAWPLWAAWMTSIVGFLAVGFSSLRILRDFAVLGTLALAGAVIATLFVLPAVLVLVDRRRDHTAAGARQRFSFEPVLRKLLHTGRWPAIVFWTTFAAVGLIVAMPGQRLAAETDLTVMHPRPNAPLEAQSRIAQKFGSSPGSLMVYLQADSDEQLVRTAYQVDQRLRSEKAKSGGVVGSFGLASLLPDPDIAAKRSADTSQARAADVASRFRAALTDSPFDPNAYEPYAEFLQTLLTPRKPPTVDDLRKYDSLAAMLLPKPGLTDDRAHHESIVLISLSNALENSAQRATAIEAIRSLLKDVPAATLAGHTVIGYDLESRVFSDLPLMVGIAAGLVMLYLAIHFRSLSAMLLVVLPTAFSLVFLVAVMRLAELKLNIISLTAAPLLIGINIDYGIFLVSLARSAKRGEIPPETIQSEIGRSCHAVLVCAATTLLAFGSLIFTSIPAIRSLGIAVAVGVLTCNAATLFYLAPLLIRQTQRTRRRDGEK